VEAKLISPPCDKKDGISEENKEADRRLPRARANSDYHPDEDENLKADAKYFLQELEYDKTGGKKNASPKSVKAPAPIANFDVDAMA